MEENITPSQELEEKAQRLLEEKEAESRTRTYTGPMGVAITILLGLWMAFQLYFSTIGLISAVNLRAIHCIFLLAFTFLLYPTYKKEKRVRKFPPIWDVALIVLSIGAFGYLILNYTRIAQNGGRVTDFELLIAGVALVLAFEAARRASGNLAVLAAAMVVLYLPVL